MSKKSYSKASPARPGRSLWLWLVVAGALLLVLGGVAVSVLSRLNSGAAPQEGAGAPKLTVDRTAVDEGYVQFNVPVRTTFRLSNAGDQPLKILGEPQVELIEGC